MIGSILHGNAMTHAKHCRSGPLSISLLKQRAAFCFWARTAAHARQRRLLTHGNISTRENNNEDNLDASGCNALNPCNLSCLAFGMELDDGTIDCCILSSHCADCVHTREFFQQSAAPAGPLPLVDLTSARSKVCTECLLLLSMNIKTCS
jgi:hypothetical protein